MDIRRMGEQDLINLYRKIDSDIQSGRLTRTEYIEAMDMLKAVDEELTIIDREKRNNSRPSNQGGYNLGFNYGGGVTKSYGGIDNLYTKESNESVMTTGSLFGSGTEKGFGNMYTSSSETPEVRQQEVRQEKRNTLPEKEFYSPKYPFVCSKNIKEVIETEIIPSDTVVYKKLKRNLVGNDDSIEFNIKYETKWDINPLYNFVAETAFCGGIENCKVPKTLLPGNFGDVTSLPVNNVKFANNALDLFLFKEINLKMVNVVQATDISLKFKNLEGIKELIKANNYKTDYLKHIEKVFKSFTLEIKDDCLELNLNKKHIYADIPDLVIPDGEKFFINECSNETMYTLIKAVSVETNSYIGIIEGFDYKFEYFIGFNKILLVRA